MARSVLYLAARVSHARDTAVVRRESRSLRRTGARPGAVAPAEPVVLFCTGSDYVERARELQEIVSADSPAVKFSFVSADLESPIDYAEIYAKLRASLDRLLSTFDQLSHRLSVLLDPGTPQMQTAWFLLVVSGSLDAELLQGVPPRFAGGAYKVRSVDLSTDLFPGISITSAATDGEAGAQAERPTRGRARGIDAPLVDDAPPAQAHDRARPEWIRGSNARLVGASGSFWSVVDQARPVARYDVSVVVRGETGTGKELVARLIHGSSPRANRAFVAINCAAITASIAESEFFGHVKGAFTGADRERLRQFRAADGGTVVLDEVGDLPLEIQVKLLRVLENHTVVPVGADEPVRVDVRVIAATNRDVEVHIADGGFRRDLYERLANVAVEIPPLRDRPEDVPLLLRHFVERWNAQYREQKGSARRR